MKNDNIILNHFIMRHPLDVVTILERMDLPEIVSILQEIPNNFAVSIFHNLERFTAVKSLEMLGLEKAVKIIEYLPADVASVFMRRFEEKYKKEILNRLSEEVKFPLERILSYDEYSAGALVDPYILTLPEDVTVEEALQRIQNRPEKAKYYIFVLNRQHILTGIISMPELMSADSKAMLSKIMTRDFPAISADLDYQSFVNHPDWQKYHTVAVVEENNLFLGVLEYKTLRRIEKETKKSRFPKHAVSAGNALGELYMLGFTGLVRSAATPFKDRQVDRRSENE